MSNISESENFLKSIRTIRSNYDVPSPSLCKIHINQNDIYAHAIEDQANTVHSKIIKTISIEGYNTPSGQLMELYII